MKIKPIFIGESPGKNGRSDCPLYPYPPQSTGGRLYDMSPFNSRGSFVRSCYRIDLLAEHPGMLWPKIYASHCAQNLKGSGILMNRKVVLVGARVASAFGLPMGFGPSTMNALNWYRWPYGEYIQGSEIAVMPYPSGLNRWYNDPTNRMRAEAFLKDLLS